MDENRHTLQSNVPKHNHKIYSETNTSRAKRKNYSLTPPKSVRDKSVGGDKTGRRF